MCSDGRGRSANPMAHVLQMIGEDLDLIQYNQWNVLLPEGTFLTQAGTAPCPCTCCCSMCRDSQW